MSSFPGEPAFFRYLRAQGASPFSGYNPTLHGSLDVGGLLGGGAAGAAANMAAHHYLTAFLQSQGMALGAFHPVQNLFDQHLARQQGLAMRQAAAHARILDRAQLEHTVRGGLSLLSPTGTLTAGQQRMAADMARFGADLLPSLAQFNPATVDALLGARGSASVLAMGVAAGSRFLPGPGGLLGLDGAAAGRVAADIHAQLYGPGARVGDMRGLGGAASGQLFEEMARRGLLPGTVAGLDPRAAAAVMGSEGSPTRLAANATQWASRLKEMAGAVSAMRDIFGDMGRGDAPMAELVAGLEALTQGGLSTMSRGRMENLVRRVQQTAKLAGVSMEAVLTMQAAAGQMAQGMGLDRSFAPEVVNSSLAFAAGVGASGWGDTPGWRKFDKARLTALDQRLRVQAASSQTANQLGALARLGEQGLLREGSDAWRMYRAALAGDDSALRHLDPASFTAMLAGAGLTGGAASAALMDREANQEYVRRFRLQDRARNLQFETDIKPFIGMTGTQAARAVLSGLGFEGDRLGAVSGRLGASAVGALRGLEGRVGDDAARNAALASAFRGALSDADYAALGPDEASRQNALRQLAVTTWSRMQQSFAATPEFAAYGGLINALAVNSPAARAAALRAAAQADTRALIARSLSSIGGQGPLRRLVDAFATAEKGTSARDVIGRFIGGVPDRALVGVLEPALREVERRQSTVFELGNERSRLLAGPQTEETRRRVAEVDSKLGAESARISTVVGGRPGGEDQAKRIAAMLGVSITDLLRGRTADGTTLDPTLVDQARRLAGLAAVTSAFGMTPEAERLVRSSSMASLLERAGTGKDRLANLGNVAAVKGALAEAARASSDPKIKALVGSAAGGELSDEQFRMLQEHALAGRLGPQARAALGFLGGPAADLLRRGGVSLPELERALRSDAEREEARTMRLEGRLVVSSDGTGTLSGTGVTGPRGGGSAPPARP